MADIEGRQRTTTLMPRESIAANNGKSAQTKRVGSNGQIITIAM